MTTSTDTVKTATSGARIALGIAGIVALVAGLFVLIAPAKTAAFVTGVIAVYALVAGIVYACTGIFSTAKRGWSRVGYALLGLLFVVAGIIALANLRQTAVWLALFLGILVGVLWVMEGLVALSTLREAPSRGWAVFYAILSIVAGIVLVVSPLWGAVVLWWLLGIALVVLGVTNIVRGFRFGRSRA